MTPPTGPNVEPADPTDFSLVLGGPLYQLFLRSGLVKPPLDLLRRRVLALPLLTWLPLLVVSALEGQALAGVRLPFLQDLEAQARFLLALPLLIAAEVVVHRRLAPAVRLFVEKGIVRPEDRKRFDAIVASTMRLRNSVAIEVVLIALVLSAGHYLWRSKSPSGPTPGTRCRRRGPGVVAGRQVLRLVQPADLPVHPHPLVLPDTPLGPVPVARVAPRPATSAGPSRPRGRPRVLRDSTYAFAPLLLGQSVIVSAMIAGRILHEGAQLPAFTYQLAGALVLALLQALGPLLAFVPGLLAAKRRGLREYGLLADRYVREFDRKWLHGGAAPGEALAGTGDIQSLADLRNSFQVVSEMRAVPFGKQTVLQLLVVTAIPMLPSR